MSKSAEKEVSEKMEKLSIKELNVEKLDDDIKWKEFVHVYKNHHNINYGAAVCAAGPAWKEYKEKHGVVTKDRTPKVPADQVIRRKQIKTTPKGNKQHVVKFKAPPVGKKIKAVYITDSESEDDADKERAKKLAAKRKAASLTKQIAALKANMPKEGLIVMNGVAKKKKSKLEEPAILASATEEEPASESDSEQDVESE